MRDDLPVVTEVLDRHLRDLERAAGRGHAEARIARGEGGVLSVGYTSTATYEVLPSLLQRYRTRWPAVGLELIELRSGLQCEALRSGRIEVGFACGPLKEEAVVERVLARERFVAALPRGHVLAAKKSLRLRDLDRQPSVAVRPDIEPAWATACQDAFARAKVHLDVVQETDTKIAMLGLVAAGVGLAIVSESMQRLARQDVVYRGIRDLELRVPLVAIASAKPSPRARALLGLLTT